MAPTFWRTSMSNNNRIIVIILTGIVLILSTMSVNWFIKNYELQEVDDQSGYSKEARRNKFLAAEYFLRELGYEVESDSNRARLLEPHTANETILLNSYGPNLSPSHFDSLKQWIASGGHLIFTTNDFHNESNEEDDENKTPFNQLLIEYGIQAWYTNFTEDLPYPEGDYVYKFILHNDENVNLKFYPSYHLRDTKNIADFTLRDQYGIHLLQFKIGNGTVTVLSDNFLFSNYNLGENDHAYLLSVLGATNTLENSKILLLYNIESDSIFTLIWKNAKHASIAFLIFIAIVLWSMQNRFGPIQKLNDFSSRNIIEHLNATARYSWRKDKGIRLLHQSRLSFEQTLLARYPVLKNMSTSERAEHLSKILETDISSIDLALFHEPQSTNEYINSTHELQKLWVLQ